MSKAFWKDLAIHLRCGSCKEVISAGAKGLIFGERALGALKPFERLEASWSHRGSRNASVSGEVVIIVSRTAYSWAAAVFTTARTDHAQLI